MEQSWRRSWGVLWVVEARSDSCDEWCCFCCGWLCLVCGSCGCGVCQLFLSGVSYTAAHVTPHTFLDPSRTSAHGFQVKRTMSLLSMPTQQPTSAHHHSFHSHTTLSMSLGSPCCHSLSPTPPTPPSKLTLQQRPRVRSVCASTPQQALLPPPAAAHHHHSQHTCCRQGVVTHSSGGQTSINADVPTSLEPEQPSTSGRSSSSSSDSSTTTPLVSFQEMQEIAAARGLHLALKTLGPFYRITCRDGE